MCKSLSCRNSITKDSKNGKYGLEEQYVLYKLFFKAAWSDFLVFYSINFVPLQTIYLRKL